MKVTLPVILSKVSSRKDRSYTLTFETRELSGDSAVTLMDNLLSEGYLLYSPNDDLSEADVPDEKADSMTGKKTQAQRLRAVIYLIWKQAGSNGSFETYYQSYMEKLIDQIKAKLD